MTLGGIVVAATLLALAIRNVLPSAPWPFEAIALMSPWLLLPALPAALVAMFLRMPRAVLVLAAGSLTIAVLYGPQFKPRFHLREADSQTIIVMTYNVASWRTTREDVIEHIRASNADVVALQEASVELIQELSDSMRAIYPHQESTHLVLLSRYPITSHSELELLVPNRLHMSATLDVDGRTLRVINAHLSAPTDVPFVWGDFAFREHPLAAQESDAIAREALRRSPTVVLTDLNAADQSKSYGSLIDAGMADSFREGGWGIGATWPAVGVGGLAGFPLARVDYVLHTPDLVTRRAWVRSGAGSDHRSVVAEIGWPVGVSR